MELVIGICDDDIIQVDMISSFLEKNQEEYQLQLIKAYSGEELLSRLESIAIDVVFLDIEMGSLNGMETAKRIRDKYPEVIIVFITGYREFALDAFEIKTLDYLIKPVSEERLRILLKDLLVRFEQIRIYKDRNKAISFSFRDNVIKLKYNEIYFFEKTLRKITVFSERGEFSFYESMDKLLKKLDLNQFIHCHNSFVVNKSKILSFKNDSIHIAELGKIIPVSRSNRHLVKESLEKNLFL